MGLDDLGRRMAAATKGYMALSFSDAVVDHVLETLFGGGGRPKGTGHAAHSPEHGARGVKRQIQKSIGVPLAKAVIQHRLDAQQATPTAASGGSAPQNPHHQRTLELDVEHLPSSGTEQPGQAREAALVLNLLPEGRRLDLLSRRSSRRGQKGESTLPRSAL